jgi:hypothetical protein
MTPGTKASSATPLKSHNAPAISGNTNPTVYWVMFDLLRVVKRCCAMWAMENRIDQAL